MKRLNFTKKIKNELIATIKIVDMRLVIFYPNLKVKKKY